MAEVSKRKVGSYFLAETLGKGGYSWVKKGIDDKSGQAVALKFMTRADKAWEKEQAEQVRTEIKSLIRVNDEHVMKLYAYNLNCKYPEKSGKTLNTILLVLEYCPGGELFDILYYTQNLDAITARTYFIQMMKGIKACHNNGIVHRDIKPQNLLMDSNYQLKITDFGLSFLCEDENSADGALMKTHYVGTRGYQAPELLKREPYKKKCDVFSAGVVLFILLTGYPPFEQASKKDKWYEPLTQRDPTTKKPNTQKFWKQHDGCGVDPVCQDLLSKMLAYKPKDRLSIDEILKHPWCDGGKKAPTHSPAQLAKVLKDRHRETRRRRRNDKKKANEMQNSVKEKKRSAKWMGVAEDTPIAKGEGCPALSLKKFPQTLTTFFCQKDDLGAAYERALNVYSIAFDGRDVTQPQPDDAWTLTTTLKASQDDSKVFTIQTKVTNLEKTDIYAFEFKRIRGPPLDYKKIWGAIESTLLAKDVDQKNLFWDDMSCKELPENDEESKEDDEEPAKAEDKKSSTEEE